MAENDKTTKTAFCKKSAERNEKGEPTGRIIFAFQDGDDPVIIDLNKVPQPTRFELECHGTLQKGGDSYASAGTGDEAFAWGREQCSRVRDNLYAGDWRAARAAGAPRTTLVLEAVAVLLGISIDDARVKWDGFDDATKKAVAADPAVKVEKGKLQTKRAEAELAKKGTSLEEAFA